MHSFFLLLKWCLRTTVTSYNCPFLAGLPNLLLCLQNEMQNFLVRENSTIITKWPYRKIVQDSTKQMVSWYSAALLFEFLKLLHTEYYPSINKNIRKKVFKTLFSKRALLRAGNSQETLARWSFTFRQHAVTNPLGFMGLFKLDICRQCIIYNQKHE